MQEQEQITS